MKLHWSSRSPFARKVVVAAYELSLVDRIELVDTLVAMTKPNTDLMTFNPLSKLPTMVLDDDTALYDSSVICEYLDHLDGRSILFPQDPDRRFATLRRQACGNGLLDFLLLYRNERNRAEEQRSQDLLVGFAKKTTATLGALEQEAKSLEAAPVDIGHIVIGCALSYLDFRFPEDPWRPECPHLTAWHEVFAARPSMVATTPST